VAIFGELTAKLDPTKIRVTQGDIPAGDWIFNGHGMVYTPKTEKTEKVESFDPEEKPVEVEKIVIQLQDKVNVTALKAEDFGIIRQFGADMSPLAGAIAGSMLIPAGFFGIMTGFAAGSMLGRNLATFSCELDDGRRFMGIADIKVFKRLRAISKNKELN
jgi:hypothetical protein